MSGLAKVIGQRIRNYRTQLGLSQEKLAELAGCHPTYIGQLERGEKNATLESIDKVASSLKISLSELFENLGGENASERNLPLECYEFLLTKSREEQEQIIKIIMEIDKYKGN
ncbi:MAG: helix-turn-helix transcriptional regulator [Clostridia bacterium]|nr:helix-turn-helix transcriptional regulator [Clostridia bacterium]